jgi:hypothetical protein
VIFDRLANVDIGFLFKQLLPLVCLIVPFSFGLVLTYFRL